MPFSLWVWYRLGGGPHAVFSFFFNRQFFFFIQLSGADDSSVVKGAVVGFRPRFLTTIRAQNALCKFGCWTNEPISQCSAQSHAPGRTIRPTLTIMCNLLSLFIYFYLLLGLVHGSVCYTIDFVEFFM